MPSHDRRSAGRRRAWGRGPIILRFEPLEKREVLSTAGHGLPDLVASSFVVSPKADWGDPITATGQITNQGKATVSTPFNVRIYASSTGAVGRTGVKLGEVTVTGDLAPGQSVPFSATLRLPASPVPGVKPNDPMKISLDVDPAKRVREQSERNNRGLGRGLDSAVVQVAPQQPASLVSTAAGVYPSSTQWGQSMAVAAQISNKSYGSAPASRVQVVLTPSGATPGSGSDVTIGSIEVPALSPWSTVNVENHFYLPQSPPPGFEAYSQYTLSILPDADYVTNPVYPHLPVGGAGIDQVPVTINVPPGTTVLPTGSLPDLATSSVSVNPSALHWGQTFEVQTLVQNLGSVDPGPFRVRFVLVGPTTGGAVQGFFLGDTMVSSLPPGQTLTVSQALSLPSRLPAGVTVSSLSTGKIAAIVDPENALGETFNNNNVATSAPVTLRVLGTDGSSTVPNLPPPWQLLAVNAAATADPATASSSATTAPKKRLFRKPPPTENSLIHNLSVFPKRVNDAIKKLI
ncbi:MAG: CARDB domain-containing protein [Isosphaeraceae bacterium]